MGFYEELYHARSGYERKNHKWVTRTGTPGHYVYTYDTDVDPRMNGGQSSGQNLTRNTQRYITPQSGPSTNYQQSLSKMRSRIEGNARALRPSRQASSSEPKEPKEPRSTGSSQNGSSSTSGSKSRGSKGSSKSSATSTANTQTTQNNARESEKTIEQLREEGKKWLEGVFSDKLTEEEAKKLRTRLGAMRLDQLGIYRR